MNIERSILEMLKHRRMSNISNEKSELELQRENLPNLNYKLWKERMQEKNKMYSVQFSKYKSYEHKLNSMKNKENGPLHAKYTKNKETKKDENRINLMKNNQRLTPKLLNPINRNNKTDNLSTAAIAIIGSHVFAGACWAMSANRLPDRNISNTNDDSN